MALQKNDLKRLAQHIFAVDEDDISCHHASILIVLATDANYSDEQSNATYPALWSHLRICEDCNEEYQLLSELNELEAEGLLPPLNTPPMPNITTAPSWQLPKNAIRKLFAGFGKATPLALARGNELDIEPVEIELIEATLFLEIRIGSSETIVMDADATRRNLYLTLESDSPKSQLEDAVVWLQQGNEGTVIQENRFDQLGDTIFKDIPSGRYMLRLLFNGQTFAIDQIDIT